VHEWEGGPRMVLDTADPPAGHMELVDGIFTINVCTLYKDLGNGFRCLTSKGKSDAVFVRELTERLKKRIRT